MGFTMNYWFIDDDEICLFLAEKLCENANVDVKARLFNSVDSLYEAINGMDTSCVPDVIFMDLYLGNEGKTVLKRKDFARFITENKIRLYVISASISDKDQEWVKSFSYVHEFLYKPLTVRMIREAQNTQDNPV